MGKIRPDYSESSQRDFVIPTGTYSACIFSHEIQQQENGNFINFTLKITDDLKSEHKKAGLKLFHRVPISGPYAWVTKKFLAAVDPTMDPEEFDPEALYGKLVEVRVAYEASKRNPDKAYSVVKEVKAFVPGSIGEDASAFQGAVEF